MNSIKAYYEYANDRWFDEVWVSDSPEFLFKEEEESIPIPLYNERWEWIGEEVL